MSALLSIKIFDYNISKDELREAETCSVLMNTSHFASGGMRKAYRARDSRTKKVLVIKLSINGANTLPRVKKEVKTQERCRLLAEEFNKHRCVIKKIKFTNARVIKFLSGDWKDQYGTIEEYLDGYYVKHNVNYVNMFGKDFALTSRNTPQAFSHFTLEFTGYEELACDIQGVGDEYTDPQIHTIKPDSSYSDGNLGWQGIWIFLAFHKCNEICKALNLKVRQEKTSSAPATRACEPSVDEVTNVLQGMRLKKP